MQHIQNIKTKAKWKRAGAAFYATYPVFAKREGLATVQLLPAVEHRLLPGEDARGVSIHHGLHNLSEKYNNYENTRTELGSSPIIIKKFK